MFEEKLDHLPLNTPRDVSALAGLRLFTAVPRSALILPFVFAVFFLFIPLSIMGSDPSMRLSVGPSKTVQGMVLSSENASSCKDSSSRRVVYSFSPEPGREVRGVANLCESSPYFMVRQGDAVEVLFVESDPAVNAIRDGNENGHTPLFIFLFIPVIVLALFSQMYWPQLREVWRARRLFRYGQMTTANVLFVKPHSTNSWPVVPGDRASEVFLEYESRTGKRCEAVAWCQNDWLIGLLTYGTKVHIAYKDDKPEKVALLECFLR